MRSPPPVNLMWLARSARWQVPLILAVLFSAPVSSFRIPGVLDWSKLSRASLALSRPREPSCSGQAGRAVDRTARMGALTSTARMAVASAEEAAAALSFCRSSPDAVVVTVSGPSPFFKNV